MTFRIGDQIVHPMHGAGTIDSIVSRRINGVNREYYELRLPIGEMRVMIPVESLTEIGVRPVISKEEAEAVWERLPVLTVEMTSNWNQRYRENMLRIKSGDLMEVAKVVKGLCLRDRQRSLSTGERKMLHNAKQILLSELVLAQSISFQDGERRLNEILK